VLWRGTRRKGTARDGWAWLSLIPFGLGAWAPIVAGVRYRVAWWTAAGVVWTMVTLAGFILSASEPQGHNGAAGGLLLLGWVGGAVTSFGIRSWKRRRAERYDAGRPSSSLRRARWPWISMIPLGFGSWAPLVAAVRCRVWSWALAAFAGVAITAAGCVLLAIASSPGGTNQTEGGIGGVLLIGAWVGGISASFAIRPRYEARRGIPDQRRRWPRPTQRSRQWSARYALAAYAATFVTVIVLGLLLDNVVDVHVTVGVGVLIVDAVLLAALVPLARRRGLALADLGLRPTLAMRSMWWVFQALVVYLLSGLLWAVTFIGHSARHEAGDLSQAAHLGTFQILIAVLAVAVSAPVVEEIFFRGLLYRSLRNRLPVVPAALAGGLLFGLVHITGYPLITLPVKAAFGVIACLLYERTGSIVPGIALHSFVDASAIDLALTGNDAIVLIVAGAVVGALAVGAAYRKITGTPAPVVG
jgi:uncharacterized protein